MLSKTGLREKLNDELKDVVDNVETSFTFPEEFAELNNEFPYATVLFGSFIPTGNAKYGLQSISIIAIARGDKDDLAFRVDKLERDIFNKLYRNKSIKTVITEVDNNNLFKNFGLDAGLFLPYGGVRFELEIPNVQIDD